jgi:phosphatidylserine/phosphatidylglycerophosphate/cardiolipin synthase-like enzyme
MKVLYLPLIRTTANYAVIYGRRWTVLEHLLLAAVSFKRYTAAELAAQTDMPSRLVVEALINLLRMSWIEVRSTEGGTYFSATAVGKANAVKSRLPEDEQRDLQRTALCRDRVVGSWYRTEDLDIVYEADIPEDSHKLAALLDTFEPNDPQIRNLLRFGFDQRIEPSTLQFRTSSRPYARVVVAFDRIAGGLPSNASPALVTHILQEAQWLQDEEVDDVSYAPAVDEVGITENISAWNFVVGGPQHLALVKDCLESARDHIAIHSCFVSSRTVEALLPDLEKAARRGVHVDLLWGLRLDPEDPAPPKPITDTQEVLNRLSPSLRARVQLAPTSSGSHAKVIVYVDRHTSEWTTVIGSCNYLSTEFDWIDASYRSRHPLVAREAMSFLLSSQLPSSGRWTPVARRLNARWSEIPRRPKSTPGTHKVRLLLDGEHYAAITRARDLARSDLEIGCDIYGVAAETSVLVPAESAADAGCKVVVTFNRPSRKLVEEGLQPDVAGAAARGILLRTNPILHAKYLLWDEAGAAISSFNWLATVVDGARVNGAELGVWLEGPRLRSLVSSAFPAGAFSPGSTEHS